MSAIANLEELCPFDGRPIGDHTMREWSEHLDAPPHTDLPFEEVPDGPVMMRTADGQIPCADSVVARAIVFDGRQGAAIVRVPGLLLELQVGQPGDAPRTFYQCAIVGTPEIMRKLGKLLRDTANGAANAAERAR